MFPVLASIATAVGALLLGGSALAAVVLFRVHLGSLDAIRELLARIAEGGETPMRVRVSDLEDAVERLPRRWEDIKREAARVDARARSVVARARQEFAESGLADERLETVADELGLRDGEGGGGGGVHAVRDQMAEVARATAPEPPAGDWVERTRRLKWGA